MVRASRAACAQGEAQSAAHVSWWRESFDHAEGAQLVVCRHGACSGGDEQGGTLEQPFGGRGAGMLGGGGRG